MNAIFKYPGSKWRTAEWIISHFPPHHSYLEPFFGSGGVLFNKPRSNIETVNDLDGDVVNLFWWIQHDPERLANVIRWTPYAREVYDKAYEDGQQIQRHQAGGEGGQFRSAALCLRLAQGQLPRVVQAPGHDHGGAGTAGGGMSKKEATP